jgi:hypothetical protein
MPDPSDHAQDRPALERLLQGIPGFQGYFEKEYRRKSDDLQRDWLADRLERAKRALGPLTRPLADAGRIDVLPRVDMLRGRIDKLIARIRGAVQGYSGFFDLVQVDEDRLDAVYEHDVYLMDQVDELAGAVEALPADPDQLAAAADAIDPKLDAVDRELDARSDMLRGLA